MPTTFRLRPAVASLRTTSPGPIEAKHTARSGAVAINFSRCTDHSDAPDNVEPTLAPVAPTSARSTSHHASPSHHVARSTSSSHNAWPRGTVTSIHTWSPGCKITTPPPLRRRTTTKPDASARATSTTSNDCVLPSTTAGRSISSTSTRAIGSMGRSCSAPASPLTRRRRGIASTRRALCRLRR